MKKIAFIVSLTVVLIGTSCHDYLDINTNPNVPTTVTPNLILPQALAATAQVLNQYNTYGIQIGGYSANAGGFGGFNEQVSYKYTANNYNNLWPSSFDNLQDYQYIIDNTEGDDLNVYFNAVARIMRVHNFQLLVDAYNDIPYSEALKGSDVLTPKYDDAAAIYAGLAGEIDEAIGKIRYGKSLAATNAINNFDIVFAGDMDSWLTLANTLKLKLMIRGRGKVTFSNTSFDNIGFIGTDAMINPGYTRDNNRENPAWSTWGFAYTGASGNKAWMPSAFIMGYYDGGKLNDPGRGAVTYYQFPATGTNQLGNETVGVPKCPNGSFWYSGTDRNGTSAGNVGGTLKGPDAGYPLFTAAESYFLQAEATLVGVSIPTSGSIKEFFEAGITASFQYLYRLPGEGYSGDYIVDAKTYITDNATPLVQINLASGQAEQLEAIITQKYIALNNIHGHEGWNEFRRTGYPSVSGTDPHTTFASRASQSTRPDRLPTRILYPSSEIQYNPENVPAGITSFNATIFWAK